MTDPAPSILAGPGEYFDSHLIAPRYRPSTGCTGCGATETVTLTLRDGRRCADCPPRFNPRHAVDLFVHGWPGSAYAYVRWSDAA